jgi:hypothetical protein
MVVLFIIAVFALVTGTVMVITGARDWSDFPGNMFPVIFAISVVGGIVLRVLGRQYYVDRMRKAGRCIVCGGSGYWYMEYNLGATNRQPCPRCQGSGFWTERR